MARIEDSPWAISVAQVASRAGQSKEIDATFPAPSGIGDEIVGVEEGADVTVVGSFDSIVDGLIFNARISAPRARRMHPLSETDQARLDGERHFVLPI